MPNYAVINSNIVENIIVGDSLEEISGLFPNFILIEVDSFPETPSIGDTYNGSTFEKPINQE